MSTVKLTFSIPEESEEANDAINGTAWKAVAYDIDSFLGGVLKYSELSENEVKLLESARSHFHDAIDCHGLILD